jgi:hypothetical protein
MKYIPTIAVLLFLAGCVPGQGITCPQLKHYSQAFLNQVADEVETSMNTSPGMVQMLKDYGVTRSAIKVCLQHKAVEDAKTTR